VTAFATADQAAGYSLPLPAATADGLLARATQAITDAAGFGILSAPGTVRLHAKCGEISLEGIVLVTAVTAVELVHADGTTEAVTDWTWTRAADKPEPVCLGPSVPSRHCGLFAVTLTHGLASVPDSLVMLTSAVAYRLAGVPAAAAAGVASNSVGGVSWSMGSMPGGLALADLTDRERCQLAKIVPVQTVTVMPA
jgi:hypothetical protein